MILDGRAAAKEIRDKIQKDIEIIQKKAPKKKPGLAVVIVGENSASLSYVKAKQKMATAVGMHSLLIPLPLNISQKELLFHIDQLNQDSTIDGILVQLPLPEQIDPYQIACAIDPNKDVDGLHPINLGKALLGQKGGFLPCTPLGIKTLLEKNQIEVRGKHVVILGRSNIVGKPLAAILMQKDQGCNATVTIAHSLSNNLSQLTRSADILVAAMGKPHFIKEDMIKPLATVIDVGINRSSQGHLIGDVDFESVSKVAGHITPVPGGVGPMTIAMLLQNTLQSFFKKNRL